MQNINKSLHVDKYKQKGYIKKTPKISWEDLNSFNYKELFDQCSEFRIPMPTSYSYRKGLFTKEG